MKRAILHGSRQLDFRRRRTLELRRDHGMTAVSAQEAIQMIQGENLAVVHNRNPIAQPFRLFHVVRCVNDRPPPPAELFDLLENQITGLGIDTHGGFIQKQ